VVFGILVKLLLFPPVSFLNDIRGENIFPYGFFSNLDCAGLNISSAFIKLSTLGVGCPRVLNLPGIVSTPFPMIFLEIPVLINEHVW
jgi:hypothetical protein